MSAIPSPPPPQLAAVRNRTFDELTVGVSASIERTLGAHDIELLAALVGEGGK